MATARMEHLGELAVQCQLESPAGAYVSSRYFAGGFAFNSAPEAAHWVEEQRNRAEETGRREDFSAAIAERGVVVGFVS